MQSAVIAQDTIAINDGKAKRRCDEGSFGLLEGAEHQGLGITASTLWSDSALRWACLLEIT
eukprot:10849281-Alexandrium_andersonii.AAC.1